MTTDTSQKLHVNDRIGDFVVTGIEKLPEISGTAFVFSHVPSGARLLWLANDDENRSFAIGFKTPPQNDTGVFHILEHSVLCGSKAYPVKEPFVNLLKTSMQTFLNAMTFPDKTVYPVASTNVTDLENLMSVYLDAVLHPAIYQRKRIFEQEGWHLETDDEGTLSYNGVVFNEMKGALSDPDRALYSHISARLFPDTAYGKESGGMPRAIPQLTYEEFLDTHARHYTLSNSYTILYGDLDIARELSVIGAHFAGAEKRNAAAPNPLHAQRPVLPEPTKFEMATTPDNSAVGLGYVLGSADQRTHMLAADILFDTLMGSNEAPLKRAILDTNLADDFSYYLSDGLLQPFLFLEIKGLRSQEAPRSFRALVENTCAEIAAAGIPYAKLEASVAQAEFNLREHDLPFSDGIEYTQKSLESWLYDDARPYDYIKYEDALTEVKKMLAGSGCPGGAFETLLLELVCHNPHCAQVELVPTEKEQVDEEVAELERLRQQMDANDIERIREEVKELRKEQETPDDPSDIAKLPFLSLSDIGPAKPQPQPIVVEAPLPCLAHELDTHGIDYAYHYFDLTHAVSYDELPLVGILSDVLGKLDTAQHSASDLDTLIEANLGALAFFTEVYSKDRTDFAQPILVVGASALADHTQQLASIPAEIWSSTNFTDLTRLKDILTQRRIGLEQYFISSGHAAAINRALTSYAASAEVTDMLGGISFYCYLKDLLAHWDERAQTLPTQLADLSARIFCANAVTVSFTGSAESREKFWQTAGTLGLPTQPAHDHTLIVPAPTLKREGFTIPSNVSYVGFGFSNARDGQRETAGAWQVASRAVTLDYLWNEVRVKGGAYGVGFRPSLMGLDSFFSYRDPSVDATLNRYLGTNEWLSQWTPDKNELEGYIVASVATVDAPVRPRALARRQDIERFNDRPQNRLDQLREHMLHTDAKSCQALGRSLPTSTADRSIVVFGPREALETSELDLEIIDLM